MAAGNYNIISNLPALIDLMPGITPEQVRKRTITDFEV
jgi:hypothetical protein